MEKSSKLKREKRISRHKRLRKKIFGNSLRPRLSIFRSNRYIYAQLIDDEKKVTIVGFNEKKLEKEKKVASKKDTLPKELSGKVKSAYLIGLRLAQLAQKEGITKTVFDRGGYKYHGRVKALADGARAGGLEF